MRKRITLAIGAVLFFIAAFFITNILTDVCIPYNAKADKINKTLYSDDEDMNKVDVCLIGGSHGLNAFNPNAMWEHAGIHAYNYCYAGETIALSKVYLEELFKKRSFSLVVLDIYYAGLVDNYFGEKDYAFDVLNKVHACSGKFDYVDKYVSKDVKKDYYFPLNRYHSRWRDLTDKDIKRDPDPADDFKLGQDYHYETNDGNTVTFPEWSDKGQTCTLRNGIDEELRGLIQLCKDNGTDILLADLPRCYNDSLFPADWLANEYAVVNTVRKIADEMGVHVLQYNDEDLKKIGFEPEKHMFNKGHMNIVGSEVYSNALADYIVSNYNVPVYERTASDMWEEYLIKYKEEYKKETGK